MFFSTAVNIKENFLFTGALICDLLSRIGSPERWILNHQLFRYRIAIVLWIVYVFLGLIVTARLTAPTYIAGKDSW
jgi:hypothetical protein